MPVRRGALFALMVLSVSAAKVSTTAEGPVPSDAEIRQILVQRVDQFHQSVGMVVGILTPAGRRIVAYGALDQGDARPLNADTVFEIGSATKVFTSLLLADLATHTSALPRLPDNFKPSDESNPYADYSIDQLYAFLASYALPRDIGSQFEYSNLGGGLLGHALARRAGVDYATLVHDRITEPLGMTDTAIVPSAEMNARMAIGTGRRAGLVSRSVLAGSSAPIRRHR
jgi:CubicO group peptidase (beta-lactamase class C family)